MVDPVVALFAFTGLVLVGALLLWPGAGLVPRLLHAARLDERVRLEDALKHAYMCERRGRPCTLESMAGRLEIPPAKAAALLFRLTVLDLAHSDGEQIRLTDEGVRSAVRVLRTHRMWERYLADRTGVPAGEWHDRAEKMEHALSAEEVDLLEARLGHPRWDPHGDPIPTSSGDLPPLRGASLLTADTDASVEVIHLEDEPPEIYQRLVKEGLAVGSRLDVVDRTPQGVRVRSEGREWVLDAVAAGNVSVQGLPPGEEALGARDTLADASPGETVRVVELSAACQGPQRRRLLDLGVVRGTEIVPELVSAGGDPVAYRIRGALIALRREQAGWIVVEPAA